MSADTIPACAEGQTAASLSAWRDGALSPAEVERLRQHVEDCAACRARLAEYGAIADGLRAIHVPDPIGGYGRKPRLSPTSGHPRRLPLSLPTTSRLRIAGSLGAVAAVLLIALAFAQVFAGFSREPGAHRTPTATHVTATATVNSTLVALPPLSWQARAPIPEGVNVNAYYGAFSLANADGKSAYACALTPPSAAGQPASPPQVHVWVTHDAGSQWRRALTISGQTDTASCVVTADDYDPNLVVAASEWALGAAPPPSNHVTYISHTGGATWQVLPGTQFFIQLASAPHAVYAIRQVQTGSQASSPITTDLAVSHDGMRSWTAIDSPIVHQSDHQYGPQQFWLNPSNGDLLLETVDQSNNSALALWHSEDAGAHWQPFGQPTAMSSGANVEYFAQSPAAGQPWNVCAAGYDATGQGQNILACTSDNGAEWTSRPVLNLPSTPAAKRNGTLLVATGAALVFAIADDGAVLAVAAQGVAPDGSITGYSLVRLPAGASQWQSLGPVPELSVLYVPMPGAGMLWAVPAQGVLLDPHNRVFTVPYP